tara:strand:- start:169 stop:393 length:225 start_codon:yes stop_codon:yes gene_type:complete
MKKLNYTLTGEELANIEELVQGMDTIKMTLTLKESDELVEKILMDIRRKLNVDTNSIINEVREQLENTYKPQQN